MALYIPPKISKTLTANNKLDPIVSHDNETVSTTTIDSTSVDITSSDSEVRVHIKTKHSELQQKTTKDVINKNKFLNQDFKTLCKNYQYTPAILPVTERIVVFGDIHGDLKLAIEMFINSKLAIYDKQSQSLKWIGGKTTVVQVGDQIDRCRPVHGVPCSNPNATPNDKNDDVAVLELFNQMAEQSQKVGGNVISLLGNHELLNAIGRLEYVSYQGVEEFKNYIDPANPKLPFPDGKSARIHAFKPGNQYGKMLGCTRLPAVIIGSNLFVHAGVVDSLINEIELKGLNDFERINIKIRMWLLGILNRKYIEHIIKYSKDSMFWSRILGKIEPGRKLSDPECVDNIGNVLRMFKIGSLVIGHTPQSFLYNKDINSTCSNKVWRVDNGSSIAFDIFDPQLQKHGTADISRRMQYLEILNDKIYNICDINGCKQETNI